MPGEPIRLGPFVGGINQLSDPTALQDNELVDAVNVELDLDGSYISRPPIYDIAVPVSGSTRMKLLGYYITATNTRLIGCNSNGIWSYQSGVWSQVSGTSGLDATAMVQYDDVIWIIATPGSALDGGSINNSLTYSAVAAIPRGGSAIVHKERLFIAPGPLQTGSNSTLLKWSDPANFSSYPGANQAFVNKGDGQKLIDVIVYNDNLLLFKDHSTYVLAFDTSPSDAILSKINPSIGVDTKDCVVAYENQLYILHADSVYEVVNFDFAKLNSKVPFTYDPTKPSPWADPTFVTILGDRLIVKYYARLYVFGLKTRVWTRWDTGTKYIGPAVKVPVRSEADAIPTYIMSSAVADDNEHIFAFRDIFDAENTETINVYIKTKNYDYGIPHRYKRLMWWGADVSTVGAITGIIQPIIVNFGVTWGQLAAFTWGQISGNTWGQPLNVPIIVETNLGGNPAPRKFAKFFKSIRFRQVNFQLEMSYDGTSLTGPIRFFTITSIIGTKQHVSKALT